MSFTSYSSSLFSTIIESDEDCIWSIKRSVVARRNKEIWNVSWIFINDDKFNWHASFDNLLILYDFIHLWFNFLNDRSILIFFVNNQIMSSNWYSNANVLFLFAYLFCVSCALINFFLMKSQIFFIFFVIVFAFWVNIRSLIDNRSATSTSKELKLIRDSNS